MKVAIPHWQGRISPVFDVARNALLVDIDNGREQTRQNVPLSVDESQGRAKFLSAMGVDVLVCGAISRQLEMALSSSGVEVIPHICGDVERVLAVFISGRFNRDMFLMPGCRGRRWRFRGGRRQGRP